jgi:hypothetical protein
MPVEYVELVTNSWHHDAGIRPTFLEAMTRLTGITKSSSSYGDHVQSWSASNNTNSHSSSASSSGSHGTCARRFPEALLRSFSQFVDAEHHKGREWREDGGAARAPEGEVTIVFSDITRAASLWEFNAGAMRDATVLHNDILRTLLKKHQGYEVAFHRYV